MRRAHPELIVSHREARGWSQAELARRAGISKQAMSLIESGDSAPRARSLTAIAAALGVDEELITVADIADDTVRSQRIVELSRKGMTVPQIMTHLGLSELSAREYVEATIAAAGTEVTS